MILPSIATRYGAYCLAVTALLSLAPSTLATDDLFQTTVAPVLARRCLSCHDDLEHKGGLSLHTSKALDGGDSGPLVVPGDPDASLLIEQITPLDGTASMPLDADPLSAEEIDAVRSWIAQGAPWPDDYLLENKPVSDLDWWSLRPLQNPTVPTLPPTIDSLARNDLDRFLLARLTEQALSFSPEADRRTLIRRLYFDLIGLPPTPQEVEQFAADPDPLAYEKLVDRLLDSPRYGEQWARHWLDVVQYGDSHGYDKDKPRPNAWPYRDYVVRAFNSDKPYTRFVQEQLAGDRLWPESPDALVATGFISAGPWDFIGHAEVPETKVDGQVARNLDRDNMVSSTLNTFMSLTVQCARCHHHKFDPVTMQDYYALQAVFAAIDRADRGYDPDPQVAQQRAQLLQQERDLLAASTQWAQQFEAAKTPEIRSLEQRIADLTSGLQTPTTPTSPRSEAYGYHSQVATEPDTIKWVQVDLGASQPIDQIVLAAADEYGFSDFGFPDRFKVEVSDEPQFEKPILVHDATGSDSPRPGNYAVVIEANEVDARYVRVTATRLWNRRQAGQPLSGDWIFALGELAVISQGNLLTIQEVTSLDSIEAGTRWGRAALIDGVYGSHTLDQRLASHNSSPSNGYHSQFSPIADATKWVQLDLGASLSIDSVRLVPAKPVDWQPDTPGFGFPVRYRIEASNSPDFTQAQVLVDRSQEDQANPGDEIVSLSFPETPAHYLRVVATKLWDRGENHFALALAEIQVMQGANNVALQAAVESLDTIDTDLWRPEFLVDGFSSRSPLLSPAAQVLALRMPVEQRTQLELLKQELTQLIDSSIDPQLIAAQIDAQAKLKQVRDELQSLPLQQNVFVGTVHAGSGAFRGRAGLGPREIRVLARGEVTRPLELALPGAIPLIPGVEATFNLPAEHDESDRRVALAHWITRADNPLTWRSIVNRVWLYHFGQGIVDSPNDFGRGGQLPSHPELLDWLAVNFRDDGQSFKKLHRLIVTSAAYRQSSLSNELGDEVDAGNRLLWRMNRRRLTAEEIRDSVLQLTGRLNLQMGGPGFQDFIVEHPEHSPHYEYHKYDPLDPATHRRSIYRFIVRSQPQPFMNTLDCADPSMSVPKREETQTALQALTLLNNQFMVSMSSELAARVAKASDSLDEQIRFLWLEVLQREPTERELQAVAQYAQQHGLANTCRMVINLNEFVFVD